MASNTACSKKTLEFLTNSTTLSIFMKNLHCFRDGYPLIGFGLLAYQPYFLAVAHMWQLLFAGANGHVYLG